MSDDLATQSLGLNKLTLWEKRQQYESWRASGRRTPKPIVPAHTGVAHTRIDVVEPKRRHTPPTIDTINDLPPGAVVRIDEGNERVDISDDLRLDMGKALLKKAEGADIATAERIANAVHTILSPIARADDAKGDAEVKNKVLEKSELGKPKSPGADDDGDPDEDKDKARKEPDDNNPLTQIMDALGTITKRLDAIEGKGWKADDKEEEEDDSGSEDYPTRGAPGKPGAPKDLAADDAKARSESLRRRMKIERLDDAVCDWRTEDHFASFQRQADQVAQLLMT